MPKSIVQVNKYEPVKSIAGNNRVGTGAFRCHEAVNNIV